jgi:hypothetical protein
MSIFNAARRGLASIAFVVGLAFAQGSPAGEPAAGAAGAAADTSGEILEAVPPAAPAPFASLSQAVDWATRERRQRARELRREGNRLYYVGAASLVAGLGGMIAGAALEQPGVAQISTVAYVVGLPVLGVGSDKVYRAYRIHNPEAPRDGRTPWLWYGVGWVSQGVGASLMFVGAVESLGGAFESDGDSREDGAAKMGVGSMFFLTGVVLHMASWYSFTERRTDANDALSFSFEPVVPVNSRGYADGAGLRLKVTF